MGGWGEVLSLYGSGWDANWKITTQSYKSAKQEQKKNMVHCSNPLSHLFTLQISQQTDLELNIRCRWVTVRDKQRKTHQKEYNTENSFKMAKTFLLYSSYLSQSHKEQMFIKGNVKEKHILVIQREEYKDK